MDFSSALVFLKDGLRMARRDWVGAGVYVFFDKVEDCFFFVDHNAKWHVWSPQQTDLTKTDWHIVP
jgi:hypothetical protein